MNREDIIRLAIEHTVSGLKFDEDGLIRFADLVVSAEREETEKLRALCQEMLSELFVYRASENLKDVTATIRARGQA
jgi:hypothetical protein